MAQGKLDAQAAKLKQLMDSLNMKEKTVSLDEAQERLRRLKLTPDTEQAALEQKISSLRDAAKAQGIDLKPEDYRSILGLPAETQPKINNVLELWRAGHPKGTAEEYQKFEAAGKPPKAIDIKPVPGTSEPWKITDEQGKTWSVDDPTLPKNLKDELASYRKAQELGEEKKETIAARHNADAINRALEISDIRELQKQRDEVFKTVKRGIVGHSFLKTVAQEVAQAELTGGKGTRPGDLMIAEGFMQLMFGVDPKALRGSPKMVEMFLHQGGWDDKAIAMVNGALTGGALSQEVRNQMLEGATRQVASWDQTVYQTGAMVDDPKTKAMIQKYLEKMAEGNSLSDLGGTKVP